MRACVPTCIHTCVCGCGVCVCVCGGWGGGVKASARTGLVSVRHGTGRAAAAARMRGVRAAARER